MTMFTGTFATYATIGIREDLSNQISNISPEETPILSSAKKGSFSQTFTEWQQDSLAAAVSTNKQLEGDDITSYTAVVPTVRVGNYAQISRKLLMVSRTDRIVKKAGRTDEYAYQVTKQGKELKRDLEMTWTANQAAAAGNATTARATAGLTAWIKSNVSCTVTANSPTGYTTVPNATRTDGAARTATEAMLQTVIQKCWTAGGNPDTVIVTAKNKQVISGFAGISTKYNQLSGEKQGTIYGASDTYVSDFGVFHIVPTRFARDTDIFVLDFDLLETAYLDKYHVEEMAKTGDADKAMLIVEWGTKVLNEAGIGLVADAGL